MTALTLREAQAGLLVTWCHIIQDVNSLFNSQLERRAIVTISESWRG